MTTLRQPLMWNLRVPQSGTARTGFSLIDLTLTCLILGIIAAVSAPRFANAVRHYQLDAAARRIEADINYVQATARMSNRACSLTFAANAPTYTTTNVPHLDRSGRDYAVDLSDLGYVVTCQSNINGGRSVTYSPSGIAQAGSPLVGLTSGVITITAGGNTRTVTIDPVTGRARRS